jgi:hypothetical protein
MHHDAVDNVEVIWCRLQQRGRDVQRLGPNFQRRRMGRAARHDRGAGGRIASAGVDADGNHATITAATERDAYFLPIIPDITYSGTGPLPVVPDARTLPWPWKELDPDHLRTPIDDRVGAALTKLRKQELPRFLGWVLGGLIEPGLASSVTDQIIKAFRDGLADQSLWPKQG